MHWICLSYFLQLRAKKQHREYLPTNGTRSKETYLETSGMKKDVEGFPYASLATPNYLSSKE